MVIFLGILPICAQTAAQLSQVKSMYVEPFGDSKEAAEMRAQLINRLRKSQHVQVAASPENADAIIKGTEQTWISGYFSLSRSRSVRSPEYQGYLSVQVIGKNHERLWSYLVTPGRLVWTSISNKLANQLANRLLEAMKEQGAGESAPADAEGSQGELAGAGATFPAPLYQQWFELFEEHNPKVHIRYDAVGSGEGIRRLQNGSVDFGASDTPLSDEAMKGNQSFIQLPTVLGGVVPIYNLQSTREPLKFTPEVLAGIYLGQIKRWSDPRIKEANRDASLPEADIVVVHRSDESGTTFVWTDYLSKVSPQWKSAVGRGATVRWPAGNGAEHNEGVAANVKSTPNSIGYVELIYAIQHQLSYGAVQNAAGHFVRADINSVAAAAKPGITGKDLRVSITDAPGAAVYPIASYTWILLPLRAAETRKLAALTELVRWMLTSGQKSCSALGYVPLPPRVVKEALAALAPSP